METNERPARRVGTFTLGVTLVVSGTLMLVAMFFPGLDWEQALRFSPLILMGLGAETLLAARGGGRVRYDWVGMVLLFVLTVGALCLCAAAMGLICLKTELYL